MKTFCIILLSLICTTVVSQQQFTSENKPLHQNAILFIFQPDNLGAGLCYNYYFNNFGIYSSILKGDYRENKHIIAKNHYEFSLGYLGYFNTEKFSTFSCGISYNKFGKIKPDVCYFNKKDLHLLSIELGLGIELNHFSTAFRYDLFNRGASLLFGYAFIKNKYLKNRE
jgi:hypothetical protein